jgi:nucleoside-diphosphate-sugar epimerase
MKRVLLTGASGCIGQYIASALISETEYELYLFVRDRDKLTINYELRPYITVLEGDMMQIEHYGEFLKTINVAILTATSWGGAGEAYDVNVLKTIRLLNLLDPEQCEQVIYFSTASVLDRNNLPLAKASELGTDYIKTKYECLSRLKTLAIAPKITVVFPTLVFGGDDNKPYSHLSGSLTNLPKWMKVIRWFKIEGSFHIIHARDIAQVVRHLSDHPLGNDGTQALTRERMLVLGNEPITVDKAIEQFCDFFGISILFRFPLLPWITKLLIVVFRIRMAAWDQFCLRHRHFTYDRYVNPTTYGITPFAPNLREILEKTPSLKSSTSP